MGRSRKPDLPPVVHVRPKLDVEADDGIVTGAAVLGIRHGLKGLDAIHVSSALSLRELEPLVVSWDERQRAAVLAEGLAVYPETVTAALR